VEGRLRRLREVAVLTWRTAVTTVTSVLCLAPFLLPRAAHADEPIIVDGDKFGGYVDTTVTVPGAPASSSSDGGTRSSGADDGVTCTWIEQSPYAQSLWDWLGASEPDGRWYDVNCSDGSTYLGVYVPPASGSVPPDVVLAGSLARSVTSRLQLPEPTVGRSPSGWALVGLPTWLWVEPGSWQELGQRTSAGPVWAELVATPVSTTWDPGDGSEPFTCAGSGTVYDRARPESVQSTDCSYTYRRSSAEQPQTGAGENDRFFTVTVTTRWQVRWTGTGGSGGTLPALTRSSSFPVAVAQRQTVVTGGSG
jgi:hypothetical protein